MRAVPGQEHASALLEVPPSRTCELSCSHHLWGPPAVPSVLQHLGICFSAHVFLGLHSHSDGLLDWVPLAQGHGLSASADICGICPSSTSTTLGLWNSTASSLSPSYCLPHCPTVLVWRMFAGLSWLLAGAPSAVPLGLMTVPPAEQNCTNVPLSRLYARHEFTLSQRLAWRSPYSVLGLDHSPELLRTSLWFGTVILPVVGCSTEIDGGPPLESRSSAVSSSVSLDVVLINLRTSTPRVLDLTKSFHSRDYSTDGNGLHLQ